MSRYQLPAIIAEPACLSDAASISAMMQRSYGQLLAKDYDDSVLECALPMMTSAQPDLLTAGTYFVVRNAKREVVGAGGWTDLSPTRGLGAFGEGHVRHVAVDPAALGQGVGRALMEEVFLSAQSFGITSLRCNSTLTAEPFYAALGFERLHDIDVTFAPDVHFPAVEMRKVLN
jgi:GNAT superfamily N-acetyltransferase